MTNDVWKVPMRPASASRARNLTTYFPGSSVKPVSKWIGWDASCAAVATVMSLSTLSRTLPCVKP
ncbi:hypothetical protein D3C83_183960 [compost metagenome]